MKKNDIKKGSLPPIEVIDLYCGIGGLSFGMKSRGFNYDQRAFAKIKRNVIDL